MSKNLWLICTAVVIVLISITLIALLILLPQETATQGITGNQYESISKQEYIYTPTKGITEEALIEEYSVGTEAIREAQADKVYKPGNVDPFTAQGETGTTGSTTSGTGTNGGATTGGATSSPDASEK